MYSAETSGGANRRQLMSRGGFLTDIVTVKASRPCRCVRDDKEGEKILNARFYHCR